MSTITQRSFAGGELAEALYARVDTVKYATGLKTCRNFIVMRHGGVTNRPGTEFVCEVKDSTKTVRLIQFVFNSDQTYVLEFGDQYMRVIRDGALLSDATMTLTGASNANPCQITYSGADPSGLANGQEVYISGITGAIGNYLNGRNFKIANVNTGTNTFTLKYMDGTAVNSTSFGAYTSGGTADRVYELSTPYLEADLSTIQYVQSADIVTLVHPNYAPRELARTGHTSWTLTSITFAPGISAPTGQSATQNGTTGSTTYNYVVTSIASETAEESLQSSAATVSNGNATLTVTNNISISWSSVSSAQAYKVYKRNNGVYGLIGLAKATASHPTTVSFTDFGITADTSLNPPESRNPFSSSGNYPSCVSYFQQRQLFANTDNDSEKIWASKSGQYTNFSISQNIQDDDAVTFTLAGRQVNETRHLVDLGKLIILTSGGEWVAEGDTAGILTPTQINAKQYSYHGSSTLQPIFIGGNILYVQARGSVVRDFAFDYQVDGYRGNELSIFSAHLFDDYTLVDWCYQQIPHSVVWAVRSDGVLLGLTYVREHQVWGWHRHDFDGSAENCVSVPEGTEDATYVVVKRTIGGADKRYIERISPIRFDDIKDAKYLDSCLSYDGRNTGSQTMTLTGSGWTYIDTLTLTSSTSFFTSSDVGNEIHLTGSDGTLIRARITAYTSATVVSVRPNITVPVAMRSSAITDWAKAVDVLRGLWHLEGEDVSVFADGFVVASPNNPSYTTVTVTNGAVTLDRPYAVIHVGAPYISDLETLDVDTAQGETLADKKMNVIKLTMFLESSRGIWAGGAPESNLDSERDAAGLDNLYEVKLRDSESYDSPPELQTGKVDVDLKPEWNSNGRIFIRQVDPLPVSVLAIAPYGMYPIQGGQNG